MTASPMIPTPDARRDAFAEGSLQTASASKIVTMCFDRLDRELAAAAAAIDVEDHFACNMALAHVQDLLTAMAEMLDLEAWEHAGSLVALYDYLLRLTAAANTYKDAGSVDQARRIVGELGDAFRAAAAERSAGAGAGDQIDSAQASSATHPAGVGDDAESSHTVHPAQPAQPGHPDGSLPVDSRVRPRLSIQA